MWRLYGEGGCEVVGTYGKRVVWGYFYLWTGEREYVQWSVLVGCREWLMDIHSTKSCVSDDRNRLMTDSYSSSSSQLQ